MLLRSYSEKRNKKFRGGYATPWICQGGANVPQPPPLYPPLESTLCTVSNNTKTKNYLVKNVFATLCDPRKGIWICLQPCVTSERYMDVFATLCDLRKGIWMRLQPCVTSGKEYGCVFNLVWPQERYMDVFATLCDLRKGIWMCLQPCVTSGKVNIYMDDRIFNNVPLTKFDFWKFLKFTKCLFFKSAKLF